MTTTLKRACLAVITVAAFTVTAGGAGAYSARVKSICKSDFYRFCPAYKVGTSQLRACMKSAGGNVSRRCIDALADSGEISSKYHSKNRNRS